MGIKFKHLHVGTDMQTGEVFIYRQLPTDVSQALEKKEALSEVCCAIVRHALFNNPLLEGMTEVDMDGETYGIVVVRKPKEDKKPLGTPTGNLMAVKEKEE